MKSIKAIFSSDYGMLGVLVILCVFFSWITFEEQQPEGVEAAEKLEQVINETFDAPGRVLIAGRRTDSGQAFTSRLNELLTHSEWEVAAMVQGGPPGVGEGITWSIRSE